jgi:small-conductance mechanosensitive channel
MIRAILILALCLLAPCLLTTVPKPALAQQQSAPAKPAVTPDQARAALDVLNDPRKRAQFISTLEAIVKAQPPGKQPQGVQASNGQPGAAPAAPPAEEKPKETKVEGITVPLAPDSLGAQVLVGGADFLNRASGEATRALHAVQSVPLLWGWVVVMVTNPLARELLENTVWRLALAIVIGLAVEYALRRAICRPVARVEALAPRNGRFPHPAAEAGHAEEPAPEIEGETISGGEIAGPAGETGVARAEAGETELRERPHRGPGASNLLGRVPLVLVRLALQLVPVVGFLVAGHLVAGSALGGQTVSRLVILAVVDAYALCIALLSFARVLLSPNMAALRLVNLRDSTAVYLMRWWRRLVVIAVFGYAIAETGLLLGLSDLGHDALLKATGFVLHVCLAIIVIQKRRAVRRWLRAPPGATGLIAVLRNRLAAAWMWIALFFIIAVWVVWAIEVQRGYLQLLHFFGATILVLAGARILLIVVLGSLDRAFRAQAGAAEESGLQTRLRVYHPALMSLVRVVVYVLCALALLQIYGLAALSWLFTNALGHRVLSALATLGFTVLLAFVVWEAANIAIEQHLARLQREAQATRSARLRTLLPLLRTTLLITIIVVAGLMVLSEIGVNIAPLLAGAGIVGVAIGFGSQKLVQDLITGIFLLLENAMQVGDWVTVSGLSGKVEALSVRTIRLRAGDGSVHIIPFSSVTSVTNVNRGLGNASVNVTVDFDEDVDRVYDALKEVAASMRADPDFSAQMLSDLQLWGVDKVDGAGVTIMGQVVCTDSGRWSVQREFNRRMKKRFQELGIGIFNPMRTIAITPLQLPAEAPDDGPARAAD